MKHPLYTYGDDTEVTASSVRDGKVRVYTERWDSDRDMFVSVEIMIPDGTIVSSNGYSEAEVSALVEKYQKLADDIIDYVREKENERVVVSA